MLLMVEIHPFKVTFNVVTKDMKKMGYDVTPSESTGYITAPGDGSTAAILAS